MHTLYTGVTKSGKTTLARMMARQLFSKGHLVIVYDPLRTATMGGDWGTAEIYIDAWQFLARVQDPALGKCHLFIDEAHHLLGHEMRENFWLLTEGRHYGYFLHLITQRPNKLHPDVRTSCETCYMFRLAQDDAKSIGNDYGHSYIHKENLDKGDFLVLNSGSSAISRGNVFNLAS